MRIAQLAQTSRQVRAAIMAASESLGVVIVVSEEATAERVASSIVLGTTFEELIDDERSCRRHFQFQSGGSITIAVAS